MSKYHNTYQRIYQEKYRFLDTVTQPYLPTLRSPQVVATLPFGSTSKEPLGP
jgi:hypothetical protein